MTAALSPPPATDNIPSAASRARLILFAILAAFWVVFLAGLTWRTANPPLVNRVQILASDRLLVGHWLDVKSGRFQVNRELKQGDISGEVIIENSPIPGKNFTADQEFVVPVRKRKDNYVLTAGDFRIEKSSPAASDLPAGRIQPQIYPATAEILDQIEQLLKPATP